MRFSLISTLVLARATLGRGMEASVSASFPESAKSSLSAGAKNDVAASQQQTTTNTCADDNSDCADKTCTSNGSNETAQAATKSRRMLTEKLLETDFGVPQNVEDTLHQEEIWKLIDATEVYMESVSSNPEYAEFKDKCRNRHESCTFWAALGECDANPGYMTLQCAPACQSCEMISHKHRCPYDPEDYTDVFQKPGDVNAMFERIISDPAFAKYEPRILARPNPGEDESDVLDGPWMLVFEKFLSDNEADRLIQLGAEQGYERSADVGEELFDGTHDKMISSGRTSTNSWCQNECSEDPVARDVAERIENITHVPYNNSEYLQMLRYQEGQYYTTHHDLIEYQADRQPGVRILTFYMYLNDVEEGGGTDFPRLGVTVTPKKGRAVLWPSVLDEDPNHKDDRTHHTALPVKKGIKYGSNAWLHQRDFKTPNLIGCT